MNKIARIFKYAAFVFVFCFMAIGYAAVQDELLINGSLSFIKYEEIYITCTDTWAYTYENGTISIKEPNEIDNGSKKSKIIGIDEGGFSSSSINAASNDGKIEFSASDVEYISISSTVTEIRENAFSGLPSLRSFTVASENTSFADVDGILFGKTDDTPATLLKYPALKSNTFYTVPSNVTSIADDAFTDNELCIAIFTTFFDTNTWGSSNAAIFDISYLPNTYTVTGITVDSNNWYIVTFEGVEQGTDLTVQMNENPNEGIYGVFTTATVVEGGAVSIDTTYYSRPAQICMLPAADQATFGHLNADNTLEIHNGKVVWLNNGDAYKESYGLIPLSSIYNLPSGTESSVPNRSSWTAKASSVKNVTVIDETVPTSVNSWFSGMNLCKEMDLGLLDTTGLSDSDMEGLFDDCLNLNILTLGDKFGLAGSSLSTAYPNIGLNWVAENWTYGEASNMQTIPYGEIPMGVEGTYTADVLYCFAVAFFEGMYTNPYLYIYQRKEVPEVGAEFDGYTVSGVYSWRGDTVSGIGYRTPKDSNGDPLPSWDEPRPLNSAYGKLTDGIEKVKVIDKISPQTLNNWFENFYNCKSFDLKNLDTSKAVSMNSMFFSCSRIATLDLSSFNTAQVTNMSNMFRSCLALTEIYVSDGFVTTNVTSSDNMFYNCDLLKGGANTNLQAVKESDPGNYLNKTYARIDGVGGPGYFTCKHAYNEESVCTVCGHSILP